MNSRRRKVLIFLSTLIALTTGILGVLLILTQLDINIKFNSVENIQKLEKNTPLQIQRPANNKIEIDNKEVFGKDLKSLNLPIINNEKIYFLLETEDKKELMSLDKEFKTSTLYNLGANTSSIKLYPNLSISFIKKDTDFEDQTLIAMDKSSDFFEYNFDSREEKLLDYKFSIEEKVFYLLLLNRSNQLHIQILDLSGVKNEIYKTSAYNFQELIKVVDNSVYLKAENKCYALNLIAKSVQEKNCKLIKFNDSIYSITNKLTKVELMNIETKKTEELSINTNSNITLKDNLLTYAKAGNIWSYDIQSKKESNIGPFSQALEVQKVIIFNDYLLIVANDLFGTSILKSKEKFEDINLEVGEVIQWEKLELSESEFNSITVLNSEPQVY